LHPDYERSSPIDTLRESVEAFARARGITTIQDCGPSRDSRKRAFRLGDKLIAKTYETAARARFEREQAFLSSCAGRECIPQLVAATFEPDAGGYLVTTVVPGKLAADLHEGLGPQEFADFARALGECMAILHEPPADAAAYPLPNTLVAERISQFDSLRSVTERLVREKVLDAGAVPSLLDAVAAGRGRAFASRCAPIHNDLHFWNILVDRHGGVPRCAAIDFEESACSHAELDFVAPFIHVLAQAFPGRPRARWWRSIWQAFVEGYSARGRMQPDLELTISHAVAWCLWGSARCIDHGQARFRELAGLAVGAAALLGDGRSSRLVAGAAA
jgi:aminoglycoside phosphotransferase (APT) family kinase protein